MNGERYAIVRAWPFDGITYALIDSLSGEVVKRSDSVAALVKYALDTYGAYVSPPL